MKLLFFINKTEDEKVYSAMQAMSEKQAEMTQII